MPISTTSRKAGPYPGNGVARDFSFDFKIFAPDELQVSQTNAQGVAQVLIFNVDYTVSLNPDQDADAGGIVTLNKPLAAGMRLVILSGVEALQPIDMTNQGGFYPDIVNEGFDRATALVQQIGERLDRTVTVPPSYEGTNLNLPEPKPGQLLAWSDSGLSNLDPAGLVTVVAYGSAVVDRFDGDGTTTVFSLSSSPGNERNMRVSVAGVVQTPGEDFFWGGGQVLGFFTPPPAGTRIVVQFQQALPEWPGVTQDDLIRKANRVPSVADLRSSEMSFPVFVEQEDVAGLFVPVLSDVRDAVAADPAGGVWVAPAGGDGSGGAWKRIFEGAIDAVWFGGRTSAAINAALAYAKWLGNNQTVKASGVYTMTETVRYEGGTLDGVHFDGIEASFRRSSNYGPTFYVSGLANGTALQRTSWTFGELLDLNNSMTVAVSRCHVLFDHVYFLNWSAPYIREGCGGVHILGCASWSDMGGIQAWRFSGPYQAESKGYLIGASEIAGSLGLKGGDAHVGSLTDVYGGRAILGLTGGTSGSSTTITMASTVGVQVGDIVEGSGWNQGDNPDALIPDGTTVTAVNAGSVVVSVAVTLPAATPLIFFKPTLEDGIVLEAIDGLWVEGVFHSIFCKRRSVSIDSGANREIFNFRIKVMPDVAPGVGLYVGGSATLVSGLIDVHHLYGGKMSVTAPLKDVTIWSPQERWSRDGYTFGGLLAGRGLRNNAGADGYTNIGAYDASGILRLNQYRAPSGEFGFNVHDAAGAYLHTAVNNNPTTRIASHHYAQRLPNVTVSGLSAFTATLGAVAYATNARAITSGGTIEGAGAGTGAVVSHNGTKWVLAGTNIEAQA